MAGGRKPPALRACGYVRLSVLSEESTSIETQSREIAAYCEKNGWKYDPQRDLFADPGVSGSNRRVRRPKFEELMANLDRYDRIVVWKLDRFTRRLAELTAVIEELEKKRVALVSIQDNVDTSDPTKRLVIAVMGGLAEQEASNIKLRVKAAQETMAKSGRWKGGNRPYGWRSEPRVDGRGVKLVLVPEEAEVLRKAVRLAISGQGPGPIAKVLNADGHLSSKGNPWTDQAIKGILRSPLMVGWHEANGVVTRNEDGHPLVAHEPLISESDWNRVKKGLLTRSVVRPQKDGAMLSGLLFCGLCGGRMHGASSLTNASANYRCRNRYTLNKDCPGTSVKALPVDQLIGEVVLTILAESRSRKLAAKGLVEKQRDSQAEIDLLEDREAALIARMTRMREERNSGLWDYDGGSEHWASDFGKAKEDLERIRERLAELTIDDHHIIDIPDSWLNSTDVRKLWNRSSNTIRRQVVAALIERVEVGASSPEWRHRHLDASRIQITKWRVPQGAR